MAQTSWAGHGRELMVGSEIRFTETPFSYTCILCVAYLDFTNNVHLKRSMKPVRYMKPLSFDHDEDFKTLELEFAPAKCVSWHQVFEDHLHSILQSSFLETPHNQHESKIERAKALHLRKIIDGENSHFDPKAIGTPTAAKVEKGRDFLSFIGTGIDDHALQCSEILHALPKV